MKILIGGLKFKKVSFFKDKMYHTSVNFSRAALNAFTGFGLTTYCTLVTQSLEYENKLTLGTGKKLTKRKDKNSNEN